MYYKFLSLSYDYNGVLEKNTVVETVKVNTCTPNLIFSPIWFSLKESKKEQSSYSGIVLNIALFGPFISLSMNK